MIILYNYSHSYCPIGKLHKSCSLVNFLAQLLKTSSQRQHQMIIVALNSQHLLTGMSKVRSQLSGSDAVVVTLANWLLYFLTDPRAATSQDGRRFELPTALHTCNELRRLQSSQGLNVMNGHRRIRLGFNFESLLQESSKLCGSFISLVHPS